MTTATTKFLLPALVLQSSLAGIGAQEKYDADRNITEADISNLEFVLDTLLKQYRQGPAAAAKFFEACTPEQVQQINESLGHLTDIFNQLASVEPQAASEDDDETIGGVDLTDEGEGSMAQLMALLAGMGGTDEDDEDE